MTKVRDSIYTIVTKFFLAGLTAAIAGCITTTSYRVDAFMLSSNSFVGKTIPEFEKYISNAIHIGVKPLPNGNLEKEYANQWRWKYDDSGGVRKVILLCHYFYEYEPRSSLIVKFRFEEKVANACQIPGV